MLNNNIKVNLKAGKAVYGVISPTTDPIICEYMGLAGFDFYMIDGEHGAIGPAEAIHMIRACENKGITPLARVRSLDPKLILQFMDAGIMGVMMPGVQNAQDVERLVQAIKYPPIGNRGLGPVRAADYMMGTMTQNQYVESANDQTLIFPQIEDMKGVENLPEMVKVAGIDGFIIGPRDLAMDMGFTDGPAHAEVKEVIDKIFEIVLGAGLIIGTVAGTKEQADALVAKGARIILNSVQGLLGQASKSFLAK